jgi:predicted nucleic acid-binding protein
MKRLFIDANVLIEILLDRRLSQQCIQMLEDTSQQYVISALTVHIVWYIAEKYSLNQSKVDEMLSIWEVLPVTANSTKAARERYNGKDFEDCLQAVCAEAGDCDLIVTIDKKFQRHSRTNLPVTLIS